MKQFVFNYNGNNHIPWKEKKIFNNIFVRIGKQYNCNIYCIDDKIDNDNKVINITDDIDILFISTMNSAHSISEILSFMNYYNNNNKIAISEYFIKDLPFLYELLKLFIPTENIIVLYENNNYLFTKLFTYRCEHFNYTSNWYDIPFTIENNSLRFNNIENIKSTFLVNSHFLFNKVEEIYNNYKNDYELYDNIALIKFNNEMVTTPSRGFAPLTNNIKNSNTIKFLSMTNFKNIFHYICVIYHAKNIIFSYGGPCCTNRFFCNQESNIVVLCNKHYRAEYEYNNDNKNYWHVRHSHLIPVKNQTFLLDFENYIDECNVNDILKLLR